MNHITDLWRQMVRRRLWPVALLLVAGLAAVPMLLAKEPEPAPPAPAPANGAANATKAALESEPIVTLADATAPGTDRTPLGDRHDIFKPTKKPPKVKAAKDDESTADKGQESKQETDSGSEGSTGGGATPPSLPSTPSAPAPEPKTYPMYSLIMRFTGGDQSTKGYLPRGGALPSRDEPLLIYLGLLDDHKTAVFMVDRTIRAIGDGSCHPTPENCETVRMRAGDTMFFDVVDESGKVSGQFELDLIKINKKQTTDAAKAARSAKLAKVSSIAHASKGVASGLGGESIRRLGVVGRTG